MVWPAQVQHIPHQANAAWPHPSQSQSSVTCIGLWLCKVINTHNQKHTQLTNVYNCVCSICSNSCKSILTYLEMIVALKVKSHFRAATRPTTRVGEGVDRTASRLLAIVSPVSAVWAVSAAWEKTLYVNIYTYIHICIFFLKTKYYCNIWMPLKGFKGYRKAYSICESKYST